MPDFLKSVFAEAPTVAPFDLLVRLLVSFALGCVVAAIYRQTRKRTEVTPSFPTTLVLLSILIAMVTQVIGDNIARAFSLVGALGIVRFRTIVRDAQDTAYVIFSVVVGMAVGAKDPMVAVIGIGVVGLAALVMTLRVKDLSSSQPAYYLNLRVGLGHDVEPLLGTILDQHLQARELMSIGTARQGIAMDLAYETRLRETGSPDELIKALNRIDGVQSAQLHRCDFEPN